MNETGKLLILIGGLILLVGVIIGFTGTGFLSKLGRLPGDFRLERENFRFYFPLTTMILLSLVLTLLIRLWRWFQ